MRAHETAGQPALLAVSNVVGPGPLQGLPEAGKRVPEDVSLICCDDYTLRVLRGRAEHEHEHEHEHEYE